MYKSPEEYKSAFDHWGRAVQHSIPVEKYGPRADAMAQAVQACVHCGFCLPTCPTYQVLGHEADSPRGRIILMKEVLEGKLTPQEAQPNIDRCLGCVACQTACPSGVHYGELISPYRDWLRKSGNQPKSIRRTIASLVLPYPWLFRLSLTMGQLVRNRRWLVPKVLQPMIDLVPASLPAKEVLPEVTPAVGTRRARVALLSGCAQQVLAPDINLSTIRLLSKQGVEVVVPRDQGCCGALAWHIGDGASAKRAARVNLAAFPKDVDAIISNAAGCGSGLHEYPLMLRGEEDQEVAEKFSSKVRDVSQFLVDLGFQPPTKNQGPIRVAYHDACHLAHAQKITSAPRQLLKTIPGLTLLEVHDSEICCGSAGTYNIDQPELAKTLGKKKAESIVATGCELVATGNIGCMVQIANSLEAVGHPLPVMHTVQLLERYFR